MTKVFISYSRKDKPFAAKFTEALEKSELETWIDWEDIPPTADWLDQIHKGIEQADGFLFLLSPDSVVSKVCGQEVDHAVDNGKRLIPIVARDVNPNDVHPALAKVNWIYGREQDNFDGAINKTLSAIRADLAWVEAHRRLQVRALEWDKRRDNSLLLRGKDLREAEEQLARAGQKDPQPTDLQRQYILESRRGESRTRNVLLAISAVVMVILVIASAIAVKQSNYATSQAATALAESNMRGTAEAKAISEANTRATAQANAEINRKLADERATVARSRELAAYAAAVREKQFDLSLLLSVEAYRTSANNQTRSLLQDNYQTSPYLDKYIWRHSGAVFDVAFSPDGKFFASAGCGDAVIFGCKTDEITLWDAETLAPLANLHTKRLATESATQLSFSQDSAMLAVGYNSGPIAIWDTKTYQEIYVWGAESPIGIRGLAFSPDGKVLVVGRWYGRVDLFEIKTQRQIDQPLMHSYDLRIIAFGSDGKLIAIGNQMGTIVLWDVNTHEKIGQPFTLPKGQVNTLEFSPDGKILASGDSEGTIVFWDVATHQMIGQPIPAHINWINALKFSPDGEILASGGEDSTINLWNVETRQLIAQLKGHGNAVNSLAFRPDGATLMSGGDDKAIIWWTVHLANTKGFPTDYSIHRIFSPDGKSVAWGDCDQASQQGRVVLLDLKKLQPDYLSSKEHPGCVNSVAFSPDGKIMAAAENETVILWDLTKRATTGQFTAPAYTANLGIAFRQDGKVLTIVDSIFGDIALWDVATQQLIAKSPRWGDDARGGGTAVQSKIMFGPGGILVASSNNTLVFWDQNTLQPIGDSLNNFGDWDFSPDGKTIAALTNNSAVAIIDVATHKVIKQWSPGQNNSLESIAYDPTGNFLALGCADGATIIWDLVDHQQIGQPLKGHSMPVRNVVFSPDGKILISGAQDDKAIFWNLDSQAWLERSCQRAGRNLTRTEWVQYGFPETYRATCPQWPLEQGSISMPSP